MTAHTRSGSSSLEETVWADGVIESAAIGASPTLDEIYEDVTFRGRADR